MSKSSYMYLKKFSRSFYCRRFHTSYLKSTGMSEDESITTVHDRMESSAPRHTSTRFSTEDALCLFTSKLDSALEKQKKDIFAEIETRLGPQVSDTHATTPKNIPKFRYEANSKQFEFNSATLDEINKVISTLKRGSVSSVVQVLESSVNALKERNKILRIADKYGWDVVDEYVDDPITDGTDDATKLRQAEYRAKMKRKDKFRSRAQPYQSPIKSSSTNDLFREPSATFTRQAPKPGSGQPARNNSRPSGSQVYSQSEYFTSGAKGESRCFYCNAEGHWAYQCPRKARSATGGAFQNPKYTR